MVTTKLTVSLKNKENLKKLKYHCIDIGISVSHMFDNLIADFLKSNSK